MGGDRDDANNYFANDWRKKKVKEVAKQKGETKLVVPEEFDFAFYDAQKKGLDSSNPDFWGWDAFKWYANAVFKFFRQECAQFYAKFPLQAGFELPDFVNLNVKPVDIDKVVETLNQSEATLLRQFDFAHVSHPRKVQAQINKNPKLKRVRDYAGKAYIMLLANAKKLYFADAIKFKNIFNSFNLEDEQDILKAYRGCQVMSYYANKAINNKMLNKFLKLPEKIYGQFNAVAQTNNLLESVGAFKTTDYAAILEEITPKLQNLKQNANDANLVQIYKNFAWLNNLAEQIKTYATTGYFNAEFENASIEELVKNGTKWSNFLQKVYSLTKEPLFKHDINNLMQALNSALLCAEEHGFGFKFQ